ncbi:hypothetical protein [Kutzneria sp. 744]|uniref:hypothetical protein n=1 Tax=Kutzneria sp. (strain 744) TaxID=345341 RepID=UPI0018DEC382|nr:hypothetical protein [Kutzneria sp. 744]
MLDDLGLLDDDTTPAIRRWVDNRAGADHQRPRSITLRGVEGLQRRSVLSGIGWGLCY